MKKIILLAVLFCAAFSVSAQELTFVSLKKNGITKLNNCNMFGTQTSVKVLHGRVLKFKVAGANKYYKLPKTYKLGACGQAALDSVFDSFFGKTNADAVAEQSDVTTDGLVSVKSLVKKQCKKLFKVDGTMVYKAFGSKGGVSFIFRESVDGIPFPGCITMIDSLGKEVTKLGLYALGGEYAARYYADVGCAAGTNPDGDDAAAIAQKSADSEDVLLDFGTACIGPMEADVCINSKAC